jgi:non-lysosomal glucosylceramidase
MLYEGMEEEGLEVMKNIRERYNGSKRSPYDEAECGHHYARAMASWSSVLAMSGFHYSGVDKSIRFTERPGHYFWSNGSAWGECGIEEIDGNLSVDFSVLHGEIELMRFQLGNGEESVFSSLVKLEENDDILLRFKGK